jgi:hypothetical protein
MLSDMIREFYKLVDSKLPIFANFVNNIIESLLQFTVSPMPNQIKIKGSITEVALYNSLIADFFFCALIHINIRLQLRRVLRTKLLQ